ncbi:MAG: hypothetical protein ABIT76_08600 [Chthoniobacterales bacterium]
MIYGTPQVHLVDESTNRIGVRTRVFSQMFEFGKEPKPPQEDGKAKLVGSQIRKRGGIYFMTWFYEDGNKSGVGVELQDRKNSTDYDFTGGFAEVSLKLHKDYSKLLEKYQGVPDVDGGDILWPATLSKESGGGGAFPGNGGTDGDINPMFGYQSKFRMEGNYRFRYAVVELPGALFDGVDYIADKLPGKPPTDLKDGRNWLMAAPNLKHLGNVWDVTENYWLSGPGGWPKPIYQKDFLK